jgi:hypothetical protein
MWNESRGVHTRTIDQFTITLVRHISDPDVWSMEISYQPRLTRTAVAIIPRVSTHCMRLDDAKTYAQTVFMTLAADLSLHANAAIKEAISG